MLLHESTGEEGKYPKGKEIVCFHEVLQLETNKTPKNSNNNNKKKTQQNNVSRNFPRTFISDSSESFSPLIFYNIEEWWFVSKCKGSLLKSVFLVYMISD